MGKKKNANDQMKAWMKGIENMELKLRNPIKTYFVWFPLSTRDSIVVDVEDDVNRPNNDDCETVLEHYLSENYGIAIYEYCEIDSVERIKI